jgi:cytoskeletal protein CcmA (bactofilin family)
MPTLTITPDMVRDNVYIGPRLVDFDGNVDVLQDMGMVQFETIGIGGRLRGFPGTDIHVLGDMATKDAVEISSNLSVDGNVACDNTITANNLTVRGDLLATGDVICRAEAVVMGHLKTEGRVATGGGIICRRSLTARDGVRAERNVVVTGAIKIGTDLNIWGALHSEAGIKANGSVVAGRSITASWLDVTNKIMAGVSGAADMKPGVDDTIVAEIRNGAVMLGRVVNPLEAAYAKRQTINLNHSIPQDGPLPRQRARL